MKWLAFALSFVLAACANGGTRPPSSTLTLSLIGTNDLHGGVLPRDGRGGLALFEGMLRNLRTVRAEDGGGVLLLDAGDLFQGTLESNLNEGAVVIAAYNHIGYTASAIGNHEFDFGPVGPAMTPQTPADDPRGSLKARASEAHFPFLAANILDEATGQPVAWPNVRPSTLVTLAGIRVGIVGLVTQEMLSVSSPANVRGLKIRPLLETLTEEARKLRGDGATVVVALTHAGGHCTAFADSRDVSSCAPDEEIFRLARAIPPGVADAIVAGHRHEGIAHEVGAVPIVSSFAGGAAFGRIDFVIDRASKRPVSHRIFPPTSIAGGTYEGRPVAASAEVEAILAPAVARVGGIKSELLNVVIEDAMVDPGSREESAVANLLTDWMRATTPGADAALSGAGGVRSGLPAGPLTYGGLYELTPFDNRHAVITVSGADLKKVIAANVSRSDARLIVSGLRAVVSCESAELRVALRRENGTPISDNEQLTAVVDDFVAAEGSGLLSPIMPLRQPPIIDGTLMRDRIAEWLRTNGRRWRSADLYGPDKQRIVFPGRRPVRCE